MALLFGISNVKHSNEAAVCKNRIMLESIPDHPVNEEKENPFE